MLLLAESLRSPLSADHWQARAFATWTRVLATLLPLRAGDAPDYEVCVRVCACVGHFVFVCLQ